MQDEEFVIDQNVLDVMNQKAIIIHPLPRVGEITTDVDRDPRALLPTGRQWFIRPHGCLITSWHKRAAYTLRKLQRIL